VQRELALMWPILLQGQLRWPYSYSASKSQHFLQEGISPLLTLLLLLPFPLPPLSLLLLLLLLL
jgi:hypothetical protein